MSQERQQNARERQWLHTRRGEGREGGKGEWRRREEEGRGKDITEDRDREDPGSWEV